MSSQKTFLKETQDNTPDEWILDGRMFRIKTWELSHEEVESAILEHIPKDSFELSVIKDKTGESKGISLLYINDPEYVRKIKTHQLITRVGKISNLRKISHIKDKEIETNTIKTTAPVWVSKERIFEEFKQYNSDPNKHVIKVDGAKKLREYPIIRMHQTKVMRGDELIKVNVIYVQFSSNEKYKYDSFIALSMKHRLEITNPITRERCTLLFDKWTTEKKIKKHRYNDID